jgi:ubiquitin-conjugating enzyme E2 O
MLIDNQILPEFPLIPASKGFCITLKNTMANFKRTLVREGIIKGPLGTTLSSDASQDSNSRTRALIDENVSTIINSSSQQNLESESTSKATTLESSTNINALHSSETKRDSLDRNTS